MVDTCEELAPYIVELSEDNRNSLQPAILKIYDIETKQHPDQEVSCIGLATMSSGDDIMMEFYLTKDQDGDYFQDITLCDLFCL